MAKSVKRKIDPNLLPVDWRAQGAAKFSVSESSIEKIAYGIRGNDKVFLYLLEMAEGHKAAMELLSENIDKRLQALNS